MKYFAPAVNHRAKISASSTRARVKTIAHAKAAQTAYFKPMHTQQSKTTVGQRVRARRLELAMSKTELARRVTALGRHCAIQNIRHIENDEIKNVTFFGTLAEALETDAYRLETGRHSKYAGCLDHRKLADVWLVVNELIAQLGLQLGDTERMELVATIYRRTAHDEALAPALAAKEALLSQLAASRAREKQQSPRLKSSR